MPFRKPSVHVVQQEADAPQHHHCAALYDGCSRVAIVAASGKCSCLLHLCYAAFSANGGEALVLCMAAQSSTTNYTRRYSAGSSIICALTDAGSAALRCARAHCD
eukprot:17151-Heterococcus_DN1.PRE.3